MNTKTSITKNFVFAQIVQHYGAKRYEIAVLSKSLVWDIAIEIEPIMKVQLWNISYQHAKLVGKCVKIIFDTQDISPNEEGFMSGKVDDFLFFEPDYIVSFYR